MAAEPVVPLGDGTDHVAYLAGATLVVRISRHADQSVRAAAVEREARVLAAVAALVSLPVPEPVFVAPAEGCLAYRRLSGVPLLDLPEAQRAAYAPAVAAELGRLLRDLHSAPPSDLATLVEFDDTPPAEWLREAAAHHVTVAGVIPPAHRRAIEAFLALPAPAGPARPPAFSHNDLGIEHVLVDPAAARITGILDWSDAALVDPATDFGRLLRDLGPAALDAALTAYAARAAEATALRDRAGFYARCGLLEDLAFGIAENRPRYVAKCLAALPWLFP
jgi:aminoglycoside phosphotransferase (APT) family kinase protein